MTIRERYDEAVTLVDLGLLKPALILALVAISGASVRYKKHCKSLGKGHGINSDREWFCLYLNDRLPFKSLFGGPQYKKDMAPVLYKEFRCEVVHKALIHDKNFDSSGEFLATGSDGQVVYGRQLVSFLLKVIRTDPLGRQDFHDLISPYENEIQPKAGANTKDLEKILEDRYGLDFFRVHALKQIVCGITPEKINNSNYESFKNEINEEVLNNLRNYVDLNSNDLRELKTHGLITKNEMVFTPLGYQILREIAALFETK